MSSHDEEMVIIILPPGVSIEDVSLEVKKAFVGPEPEISAEAFARENNLTVTRCKRGAFLAYVIAETKEKDKPPIYVRS